MASKTALQAPSNNTQENTLLALPRELRDQIWSYVLDSKYENVNHWHPQYRGFDHRMLFYQTPSPRTTMLRVSRQFSSEGKASLYQHSTFRINCDYVTGLALPLSFLDTHMIRMLELQISHSLFLERHPEFLFSTPDPQPRAQWLPREIPTQFIAQLEKFGSSDQLRAEICVFYLNTRCYNKQSLPVIIPVLHALRGFETLILKIAVCPPRFSSPPAAWLLREPFKTELEAVLGRVEFTDHEGRSCLVFRPRDQRFRRGTDVLKAMGSVDEGECEEGSVDS